MDPRSWLVLGLVNVALVAAGLPLVLLVPAAPKIDLFRHCGSAGPGGSAARRLEGLLA